MHTTRTRTDTPTHPPTQARTHVHIHHSPYWGRQLLDGAQEATDQHEHAQDAGSGGNAHKEVWNNLVST